MSSTAELCSVSGTWVEDGSITSSTAVMVGGCSVDEEEDEKNSVIFDPIEDMSEGSVVSSLLA